MAGANARATANAVSPVQREDDLSETTIRATSVNDIPVLEVFSRDADTKPLCLLFHGVTAHKEFMLKQAYCFARKGLYVVVPDCPMHGERNPDKKAFETIDVVLAASEEIDPLIAHYDSADRVDNQRTGIVGVSMGGFVVYHYVTKHHKKCRAAAAIVSTPDWTSMQTDAAKKSTIEAIQPIDHYKAIPPTPLLMMNGGADPVIPAEGPRKLYDRLYPLYKKKEDLVFELCEGVSHFVTAEMDEAIGAWIARHLT